MVLHFFIVSNGMIKLFLSLISTVLLSMLDAARRGFLGGCFGGITSLCSPLAYF